MLLAAATSVTEVAANLSSEKSNITGVNEMCANLATSSADILDQATPDSQAPYVTLPAFLESVDKITLIATTATGLVTFYILSPPNVRAAVHTALFYVLRSLALAWGWICCGLVLLVLASCDRVAAAWATTGSLRNVLAAWIAGLGRRSRDGDHETLLESDELGPDSMWRSWLPLPVRRQPRRQQIGNYLHGTQATGWWTSVGTMLSRLQTLDVGGNRVSRPFAVVFRDADPGADGDVSDLELDPHAE